MNLRAMWAAAGVVCAMATMPVDTSAQGVEHGRGNILAIDVDRGEIELRDPQNRVVTRRFDRGASVKFTDGRSFYPNPSVQDLRPPMYVHYTFRNDVIESFDVVELGFNPADRSSGSTVRKQQGVSRTVIGRVTAYDPSVRQVEIEHGGTREAFQLTDRSNQRLEPGDRVELRTDWSGQNELVTQLRVTNRSDDRVRDRASRNGASRRSDDRRSSADSDGWVRGRVVRVNTRGVVMDVGGDRETYSVASSRLLRDLREGDTVEFVWEDRDGRLYITDVR